MYIIFKHNLYVLLVHLSEVLIAVKCQNTHTHISVVIVGNTDPLVLNSQLYIVRPNNCIDSCVQGERFVDAFPLQPFAVDGSTCTWWKM